MSHSHQTEQLHNFIFSLFSCSRWARVRSKYTNPSRVSVSPISLRFPLSWVCHTFVHRFISWQCVHYFLFFLIAHSLSLLFTPCWFYFCCWNRTRLHFQDVHHNTQLEASLYALPKKCLLVTRQLFIFIATHKPFYTMSARQFASIEHHNNCPMLAKSKTIDNRLKGKRLNGFRFSTSLRLREQKSRTSSR